MRLSFAISTSIAADIILMDEWLSVGDPDSQQRLQRLLGQAKMLVLASHDEHLIRRNCNKIMRLEQGRLVGIEAL